MFVDEACVLNRAESLPALLVLAEDMGFKPQKRKENSANRPNGENPGFSFTGPSGFLALCENSDNPTLPSRHAL